MKNPIGGAGSLGNFSRIGSLFFSLLCHFKFADLHTKVVAYNFIFLRGCICGCFDGTLGSAPEIKEQLEDLENKKSEAGIWASNDWESGLPQILRHPGQALAFPWDWEAHLVSLSRSEKMTSG